MPDPSSTGALGQVISVVLFRSPQHIPPRGETKARQEMFHMGIEGILAPFLCFKGHHSGEMLPGRAAMEKLECWGDPSVALPWADTHAPRGTQISGAGFGLRVWSRLENG